MAGFYAQFLADLKEGIRARRPESWFHAKIETRNGMQTQYASLNYDLRAFLEWLERMAADEALGDVQPNSIVFGIGGS